MVENAIGYALIVIGLMSVALQRLYSSVPMRELKRLAGRHDKLATRLYRVVAYGTSLRLLLWTGVVVGLSAGLILVVPKVPVIAGLAILVVVALLSFVVLPSLQLTQRSAQFAATFVGPLAWILAHTQPLLDKMANLANRFREMPLHSRLYEKEDLLHLLGNQKEQVDNRIHISDLDLMQRTLTFGDKQAADLVQPRKEAHLVNADDSIGPILLDQLHKQKNASFLVYKDTKDNIIGSLALRDAINAKQGGRVFDLIRSDLIFVHEDFTARQVLNAFQKTGHQVAVVINNAEEFIGVITFDHLLKELLGEPEDEDILYGSRSTIAAYKPKKETESFADVEEIEKMPEPAEEAAELAPSILASSPEATEVVE